jgi:hypothetical protein
MRRDLPGRARRDEARLAAAMLAAALPLSRPAPWSAPRYGTRGQTTSHPGGVTIRRRVRQIRHVASGRIRARGG